MKEGKKWSGEDSDYIPGSKEFKMVKTSEKAQCSCSVIMPSLPIEQDVLVTMIFDDNEAHQVGGIFFNSPKLREQ